MSTDASGSTTGGGAGGTGAAGCIISSFPVFYGNNKICTSSPPFYNFMN